VASSRNHYNEAESLIHLKVEVIASCFAAGTLRDELFVQEGRSYRLNPRFENIRENARGNFEKRYQEMRDAAEAREISRYIREDCGGHIGDGEWL